MSAQPDKSEKRRLQFRDNESIYAVRWSLKRACIRPSRIVVGGAPARIDLGSCKLSNLSWIMVKLFPLELALPFLQKSRDSFLFIFGRTGKGVEVGFQCITGSCISFLAAIHRFLGIFYG